MELLPASPKMIFPIPLLNSGDQANPKNGAKLFQSLLYNPLPVSPLTKSSDPIAGAAPAGALGLNRFPKPDTPKISWWSVSWIARPFGIVGTPM